MDRNKQIINNGISYSIPRVIILQETGLGVPEVAARTCYDSFSNSENEFIKTQEYLNEPEGYISSLEDIDKSALLDDLAWTHFHHSILEHTNISYLIQGTSRGVLQEHARHRMQNISVRSTRYTMSGLINAFTTYVMLRNEPGIYEWFEDKVLSFDMFVTTDKEYNKIQIKDIFNKLDYQGMKIGIKKYFETAVAKSLLEGLEALDGHSEEEIYEFLSTKKKRNVGDAFKHIITDNFKVDMVVTMNLRALKNYLSLRDSGAAFFQIQELAKQMKEQTPDKYLRLIDKKYKD